jgi:hypothetical protein
MTMDNNGEAKAVLRTMLDASVADSPLNEVDEASLDELFDRINRKLIEGMPETITDADLLPIVKRLRAQRVKFALDQASKAAAGLRKAKPTSIKQALTADEMDI